MQKSSFEFEFIPKRWVHTKIKYIANTIPGGTPSTTKDEYWDNGDIPWLPSGKLKNGDITTSEKFITKSGLDSSATKMIKANTTLVALTGATCANIGYLKFDACANQSVIAIDEILDKADSRFLFYAMLNSREQILSNQSGGAQAGVNSFDINNIELLIPTLSTQSRIAAFLDKKTAEIETIIQKKENLLLLLEEKKKTIINEAITKGLNPNVLMKDSGVDRIGEIPEHWNIEPLGFLGNCQNGVSKGGDYFGKGFPFVNYGDIYKNYELPKKVEGLANSTEEDRIAYSVEKGDVFFTRTSETIEEIGIASTCLETVHNAVFSGFTIRFRPNDLKKLFPLYSKYFFRSDYVRVSLVKEMNIVTRASLSQTLLRSLKVILPPFEEQKNIGEFIDSQFIKIEEVKKQIGLQIEKLKEYRQSLISEAVTGKIEI